MENGIALNSAAAQFPFVFPRPNSQAHRREAYFSYGPALSNHPTVCRLPRRGVTPAMVTSAMSPHPDRAGAPLPYIRCPSDSVGFTSIAAAPR